MLGNIRCDSVF